MPIQPLSSAPRPSPIPRGPWPEGGAEFAPDFAPGLAPLFVDVDPAELAAEEAGSPLPQVGAWAAWLAWLLPPAGAAHDNPRLPPSWRIIRADDPA